MITAPNMPLPMWCSAGAVPQWYIQMPANSALNWYTSDSPGCSVRISTFGATSEAWKSIEWPILPLFVSVTLNTSPTWPRRMGPGTWPLNVHISWVTPGATSMTFSVAANEMSCTVAPGAGCSAGSKGFQSATGVALASIFAPVAAFAEADADAPDVAAEAPPEPMVTVPVIPAASCPGTSQYMVYVPGARSPSCRVADSPGLSSFVTSGVPLTPNVCDDAPWFVTSIAPP